MQNASPALVVINYIMGLVAPPLQIGYRYMIHIIKHIYKGTSADL